MNFSYTILAMVVIVIYLKDSLSSRFSKINFPLDGAKPIFLESLNIGYSYLTYILVSCIVLSTFVALTNKIKKSNANNRVQSVINAHALLVVLALIVIVVIYPCVVGIKELLADSRNDVFTFWLFVFTVLGVSVGFPVFFAFLNEWRNVTAKYDDSNNGELIVAAQLAHNPVQDVTPVQVPQVKPKANQSNGYNKSKNFKNSRSVKPEVKKHVANNKPKSDFVNVPPQPQVEAALPQPDFNNSPDYIADEPKSNFVNVPPQIEAPLAQPDFNNPPDYLDVPNYLDDRDYHYDMSNQPSFDDMPDYLDFHNQPPLSDDDFDYQHNLAMRNQYNSDQPYANNHKVK